MWLTDLFNKIFRKKHIAATAMQSDVTAMQSDVTAMQSDVTAMQSDVTAMQHDATSIYSDANRFESQKPQESTYSDVTAPQTEENIRLEKGSLQLGLAAGYTGRSIHDILSSLNRIESMMITREWFSANDKSQQLYELVAAIKSILESHDKHTLEKFESIERFLDSISLITERVPEPIKSELTKEIKSLESELPLSPKMNEVLKIVKEVGEISYKDLTTKSGYKDVSSLRSLLSHMLERTNEIEKFDRDGEKWVRVTAL